MPHYRVTVGDSTYKVDAPDEQTAWSWANQTHDAEPPKKTGIGAALGKGIEGLTSSFKTTTESLFGNANEAAAAALKRQEASPYADQVGLEQLKGAWDKGW